MKLDIIETFFAQGYSVADLIKLFPQYSKYQLFRKLRVYNIKKYYNDPKNALYHTPEYKEWRKAVLERDNHRCIVCGHTGSLNQPLQIDHIKPKSLYPELMYTVSNGRTLCYKHHRKTDTYGRNKLKKYIK
jgi:hypothetical protein